MSNASPHVIAREGNVVHVDFTGDTRPPRPTLPGATALRKSPLSDADDARSFGSRSHPATPGKAA